MLHSKPGAPPIVGFARTAKIAGLEPPTEAPETIRERRMEYFRSMATGPDPSVAVIEDLDFPNCVAAWWGEVHAVVHKGLGLAGAVTNGVMRDLDMIEEEFSVLAGSIGPSHGFVHAVEIGTPVEIYGIHVSQNELIHADRHGALVIPPETIPDLKASIETVIANEAIVLEPAREPGFNLAKLEESWKAFEAARQGYDIKN